MKRLRALWASLMGDGDRRIRLGRVVGLLFLVAGFVLIGLGWNGAANRNFETGQFPYLLSGGVMGLALVITGSILLMLATISAERQTMTDRFDEMVKLLSRNLGRLSVPSNGSFSGEQVVVGDSAYHRAGCKVLDGKDGLWTVPLEQAILEKLAPCRVCDPPVPAGATNGSPQEEKVSAASEKQDR
jgi:hypothetical protein